MYFQPFIPKQQVNFKIFSLNKPFFLHLKQDTKSHSILYSRLMEFSNYFYCFLDINPHKNNE
jgi:hypothetical protein